MVLEHALSIVCVSEGRWTVSVDGGPALGTFGSQGDAWEAGVRENRRPGPAAAGAGRLSWIRGDPALGGRFTRRTGCS